MRRRVPIMGVLLLLLAGLLAACDSDANQRPNPGPTKPPRTTELTFGVWGSDREIAAYQSVVDTYNASATGAEVTIKSWPTAEALADSITAGERPPEIFLLSREDLEQVAEAEINKPLLELVDERGVELGDGYARDAVLAFSAADELQCMPYGISPMVIYYNKQLIDFERMAERELPTPNPLEETEEPGDEETDDGGETDSGETDGGETDGGETDGGETDGGATGDAEDGESVPEDLTYPRLSFEEFQAAAKFASRPRRQTKGIHVEPTLRGLAPFIYSGGGNLFDDDVEPASLAFSSDETRDALTPTLELLRDPALTLTEDQLTQASAFDWFKRGKLAMIAGFRSMVPELRGVPGLDFDVLPMPTLGDRATIGDFSGLCISARPGAIPEAADFLVYVVSAEAVARVATAGYLVPANLQVAASDDFLQPGQQPAASETFNTSMGDLRLLPLIDSTRDLEAAVAGPLRQLLTIPVLDTEALTTQIDEESRAVLDPDSVSGSPDPEATESDEE